MLFISGLAILIAGGCLQGSDSMHDVATGTKLVRAGYCIVAVFVAFVLSFQVFFWSKKRMLSCTSALVSVFCFTGYYGCGAVHLPLVLGMMMM